ncbi:MAG: branched-chain amino acid ABC transporter substrate-binding protein [Betaproteobacteria bacterium]|nr:branched-chain amino acid ABC transporter substrate-binding protein [Betaproteobacteria bacterium]
MRIAFIDPLSGPFANAGESSLRHFRSAIDVINDRAAGGVDAKVDGKAGASRAGGRAAYRFEITGFDNKASAQDALTQLRLAIDQGYRIIVQGQSSAAATALSDAIGKHNAREPARPVLFLNYAALDPDLTNSLCSFWHFRFDANSDMRVEALASVLEKSAAVKSVYVIGQNYSFGQQVSRAAREVLGRRRPDIRIVGDELHPLGQVKDFAPYVAKIRASGADTVITGNWGNDLALLVKAAREAALDVNFYTFFAGSLGAVSAIGEAGAGRVKQVNEWHANVPSREAEEYARRYKAKWGEDLFFYRIQTLIGMLAEAVRKAGSAEPAKLAFALEGMRYRTPLGEVEMRAADHQLLQPLFVSTLARTAARGGDKTVRHDVEGTGLGFSTDARIEPWVTALPTSCQMKRPTGR